MIKRVSRPGEYPSLCRHIHMRLSIYVKGDVVGVHARRHSVNTTQNDALRLEGSRRAYHVRGRERRGDQDNGGPQSTLPLHAFTEPRRSVGGAAPRPPRRPLAGGGLTGGGYTTPDTLAPTAGPVCPRRRPTPPRPLTCAHCCRSRPRPRENGCPPALTGGRMPRPRRHAPWPHSTTRAGPAPSRQPFRRHPRARPAPRAAANPATGRRRRRTGRDSIFPRSSSAMPAGKEAAKTHSKRFARSACSRVVEPGQREHEHSARSPAPERGRGAVLCRSRVVIRGTGSSYVRPALRLLSGECGISPASTLRQRSRPHLLPHRQHLRLPRHPPYPAAMSWDRWAHQVALPPNWAR